MRSSALRLTVLISSIVISVLIVVQIIWLNKLYSFEQKNFTNRVVKIINDLYLKLPLIRNEPARFAENIERPDPDNYIFRIDSIPSKDSLIDAMMEGYLEYEVFTDSKLAVYDISKGGYLYEEYLPAAASHHPFNSGIDMKAINRNFSYIHIFFPHRSGYILKSLWLWISLSLLLIIVLLALGVSIFYLYKQKFLNEIQKDFINNVTHEFQTPLTTLQLGLDVLNSPGAAQQPEKVQKYAGIMRSQTEYLRHHLENLMLVIRADADVLVMNKTRLNINSLVQETIHQLGFLAEEKRAVIKFIPEPTNRETEADKNNLILVLVNLITNAIKYSDAPEISITTLTDGDWYVIAVKDNGIGIDEHHKKKLFQKFYRVPNDNVHDTKGLGLGLYFVKKVIDMHNGRIQVNSVKGKGTEFRILLPLN
jgi:two-component system phosphate regulon sensor histidine kinase PhoR